MWPHDFFFFFLKMLTSSSQDCPDIFRYACFKSVKFTNAGNRCINFARMFSNGKDLNDKAYVLLQYPAALQICSRFD